MAEQDSWSFKTGKTSNSGKNGSADSPAPERGPWSEIRGGLPAQDAHLSGMAEAGAARPEFHMDESDHWLGRVALYYVAHPTIPNLYHCCFDYIEPWDWSRETEHVPTGRWVYLDSPADD